MKQKYWMLLILGAIVCVGLSMTLATVEAGWFDRIFKKSKIWNRGTDLFIDTFLK